MVNNKDNFRNAVETQTTQKLEFKDERVLNSFVRCDGQIVYIEFDVDMQTIDESTVQSNQGPYNQNLSNPSTLVQSMGKEGIYRELFDLLERTTDKSEPGIEAHLRDHTICSAAIEERAEFALSMKKSRVN